MVKFIIGVIIGGMFGFFTACLMEAGRDEDE